MTDRIPSAEEMAARVREEVVLKRLHQEEEIALWCIEEFIRQFAIEPREYIDVTPPFEVSHQSWQRLEDLLQAKGWYFKMDSFTTFTISPNSAARVKAEKAIPYIPNQAVLDQIPPPDAAAQAIREKVTIPRMRKAEEFALWCVQEFARKFEEVPDDHIIVSPPYPIHHDVWTRTEKILQDRGWYIGQWSGNRYYVSPRSSSGQGAQECARSSGSQVFF